MEIKKSGMITIAGRPNAGKSTLLNRIIGEKVSIVTNKPQTTRNRICAVLNRGDTQIVFMDTPGLHKPRSRLGDYMVRTVNDSIDNVDAVIMIVEPIPNVGQQEQAIINRLKENKVPAILAVNKIDTVKKEQLLSVIAEYSKAHEFDAVVPISAKTGEGVEDLISETEKFVLEGPPLFPEDMISDQPEKQIAAEIIREKLLLCLEHEIPHGTAVEVESFHERENGIIDLGVVIYCEKASHKSIIIGKQGASLKKIGELARKDLEEFFGNKIYLQTWVKVKENWRDNETQLRNFGYE